MSIINFHSYQPLVKAIADEDAEEVAKQAGQLKESSYDNQVDKEDIGGEPE